VTDQERYTPNQMAVDAEVLLARLISEREAEKDKAKRQQLTFRIKSARMLRKWAKTRAGYAG
jgi:hypothetical protein